MNISEALLIFVASELIAGVFVLWKFAAAWGSLRQADKNNHEDINNLGKKVRRFDRLAWTRLDNIETFLQEYYNYNPQSLDLFEDDK